MKKNMIRSLTVIIFLVMASMPSLTFSQVTFAKAITLEAPDVPYEMARGDFNGDGNPDIVTSNFTDDVNQQVTILLSNNSGAFTGSDFKHFGATTEVTDIATGDFNKDGDLDLVVCSPSNSNFSLLLGDGTGGFAVPVNFTAGTQPRGISTGDVNKDGNVDVLVSHLGTPDDVYVFLGNGSGSFAAPLIIAVSTASAYDISVGEFNGDTNPDFALSTGNNSVQIWQGNGQASPSFALNETITGVSNASSVDAVDVDGDGDTDVMIRPGYALNDGTGQFGAAVTLPETGEEYTLGDINGDGHPDIAAVDFSTSIHPNVLVFLGDGAGAFERVAKFEVTSQVRGLGIVDANLDGRLDIVVAGPLSSQGKFEVLLGDGTGFMTNAVAKYPLSTAPRDVVKGDFNKDGEMDVVFCHSSGTNNVSVFFGVGQGRFIKSNANYTAGPFPFQIITIDYNKDGNPDLVTFNQSANSSVTVFTNNGSGLFTALPDIPLATTQGRITSGDFNKDSNPDLAVSGGTSRLVFLIMGTGAGFAAPTSFAVSQDIVEIKSADFNDDSNPDLVGQFNNANKIVIITGNGTGAFAEGIQYDCFGGDFILIDDFNGNGTANDILAFASGAGNDVFVNNGAGVFTGSNLALLVNGTPLDYADMDGDGFKDLFVGSQPSNSTQPGIISITKGTATGPSTVSLIRKDDAGGNRLVTHDFNGDGKLDIIATSFNNYEDSFSVLLNVYVDPGCSAPVINSESQSQGWCAGEEVTLSVSASGTAPLSYQWKNGGFNMGGQTSATLKFDPITLGDAGTYSCVVTNGCGSSTTTEDIVIIVSEGPCITNEPPVIEPTTVNTSTESIVEIDLVPLISDPEDDLNVNSFQITDGPSSNALAFIDDGVLIINYQGTFFNGTDQIEIQACDVQGSCTQEIFTINVGENSAALIIYNGISMNGDGMNAIWRIQNIELFDNTRNNEVTIYNRWGDEVYAESNYNNGDRVFDGKSKSGSDLPSGTYFYLIEFKGGLAAKTGFLVLKR
jgi:gliding motility-associated-like protein